MSYFVLGAGVSHDSGLGGSTDKIPSSPDARRRSEGMTLYLNFKNK